MTGRALRATAGATLALVLGGCAQPEVPAEHFYRLLVTPPEQHFENPRLTGTLMVRRFSAAGLLSGRAIVYTKDAAPSLLEPYHYRLWAEPLPRLLQDVMVGCLRESGFAQTVVTPELRVAADYVLSAKVRRFEQVRGETPRVTLAVEVGLRRVADQTLLGLRDYALEAPADNETVAAAVDAFGRAMSQVCTAVIEDFGDH